MLHTRLQCAGPMGVTGWAVSSHVEGSQSDQVRSVAGQIGETHMGVWGKARLDLLTLVLPVPLPVVNLHTRKNCKPQWFNFTSEQFYNSFLFLFLFVLLWSTRGNYHSLPL